MLAINLKPELEKLVLDYAERNGQSPDAFVREAIARMIEEMEDIAALEQALSDPDHGKTISHDQMKRELGLED